MDFQQFDEELQSQQKLREKFAREHPKQWAEYARRKEAAMRCFDRDRMRKAKVAAFRTARERGERASLDLSAEWTRAHVEPARVPQGRAPRAAGNEHRRGSRRGERSRSSSSDDPDPEPEPRVCECGCGAPLDHLNADARFLNAAHRARTYRAAQKEEGFEPLSSIPRPCDACPHPATLPDEDGDPVCVVCGMLLGTPSRPNGHEVVLALMVTDGDGQRRRVLRRRHIGAGRWGGLTTRLPSDAAMRPRPVQYKRAAPGVAADRWRGDR
jgi:hypothetical protein